MSDHKHTIGALESFLNDIWNGESEMTELNNVVGYNELKYVVEQAKLVENKTKTIEYLSEQATMFQDETIRLEDRVEYLEMRNRTLTIQNTRYIETMERATWQTMTRKARRMLNNALPEGGDSYDEEDR